LAYCDDCVELVVGLLQLLFGWQVVAFAFAPLAFIVFELLASLEHCALSIPALGIGKAVLASPSAISELVEVVTS
jgi:hypothetical protein